MLEGMSSSERYEYISNNLKDYNQEQLWEEFKKLDDVDKYIAGLNWNMDIEMLNKAVMELVSETLIYDAVLNWRPIYTENRIKLLDKLNNWVLGDALIRWRDVPEDIVKKHLVRISDEHLEDSLYEYVKNNKDLDIPTIIKVHVFDKIYQKIIKRMH